MRVIDLGCRAGSLTLGIAAAVAPGEVLGVDLQAGVAMLNWRAEGGSQTQAVNSRK